jgi:hypothetical protein
MAQHQTRQEDRITAGISVGENSGGQFRSKSLIDQFRPLNRIFDWELQSRQEFTAIRFVSDGAIPGRVTEHLDLTPVDLWRIRRRSYEKQLESKLDIDIHF